jgi:hypothetical protein
MMNLNNNPTIDQLAQLFAARKDSLDDHLLWVSQTGEVRLDRLPPNTVEDEFEEHLPSMPASRSTAVARATSARRPPPTPVSSAACCRPCNKNGPLPVSSRQSR